MSTLSFLFEGRMEQEGFRALLAPFFTERRVQVNWSNRYQGREDLIRKLPRLIRVVSRLPQPQVVFVLVDYFPPSRLRQGPHEYGQWILNRVDQDGRHLVKVHLAVPDIEGWIVAERAALAKELVIGEEAIRRVTPEECAADYVHQLFKQRGRHYVKTKAGVQLLGRLNLRLLHERCPEGRAFLEDIASCCGLSIDSIL